MPLTKEEILEYIKSTMCRHTTSESCYETCALILKNYHSNGGYIEYKYVHIIHDTNHLNPSVGSGVNHAILYLKLMT